MIFYFYCSLHDLFVCINLILRFHNLIMGSKAQKEVIKHAHCSNIPALLSTSCVCSLSLNLFLSSSLSLRVKIADELVDSGTLKKGIKVICAGLKTYLYPFFPYLSRCSMAMSGDPGPAGS